jgi:hypothetical protein
VKLKSSVKSDAASTEDPSLLTLTATQQTEALLFEL